MMLPSKILCLDLGNSLVKMGYLLNGNKIITEKYSLLDVEEKLKILFQHQHFDGAILSAVINVSGTLLNLLNAHINKVLLFNKDLKLAVKIRYQSPQTLGNDRIALACAPYQLSKPTLIIGLGSCITYNFINAQNEFLGGNIAPGLEMRLKSMNYYTQKLPLVAASGNVDWVAGNTEVALRSGAIVGIAGEITYYVKHLTQQFNQLKVILTGGDADLVSGFLEIEHKVDADLLMKGLLNVWELNKEQLHEN